jgi:tyrosine-protein kinase Etk/Wzc
MSMEATNGNGIHALEPKKLQLPSPREFLLRYIKYLPWLLVSLAVALVLAKIKLRYATPIYKTEARLLIKKETPYSRSNDKFDEIFAGGSIQNVYNEIEILRSRPLAARVVKALHLQTSCYNKGNIRSTLLYSEAPITLFTATDTDSTGGFSIQLTIANNDQFKIGESPKLYSFGESIRIRGAEFRVVKLQPQVFNALPSNVYVLTQSTSDQAANALVGGLGVVLSDNYGQIINLSYESENTDMAVAILNSLMAVYKESNIEDKRQMKISTLEFIDERLDSLREELGDVEKKLTQFVEEKKAFQLDKQSELYLEKLNTESSNLAQQDLKLAVIDYLINYLNKNSHRAVPVELGTQEPTLFPLITQYNQLQVERQNAAATMPETNPYIQQNLDPRLDKLRQDILEALHSVRQSYAIARGSIVQRNNEMESKLQSIPSKGQQLAERNRQQKIKEELYLFLLQKKEETAIASASTISDSKVVEPARPGGAPISPNSRSVYMIAFILGLVVPGGIIAAKEYLNDKVHGRVDIEKLTDAPFMGEIGHSEDALALVVKHNSRRFISEQFRIIRTNLQFILSKVQDPVILVTSSFSGEGKSFVSTNIGAVMALTGKKTVIMELDIRKPKVVSNLDLKRQKGITNYIISKASLDEIILPVPNVENLYVIPCGPVPPNPAEMLLDPKLEQLFDEVKKKFDIVIVDTAPVGLVSDAMVIGRHADCTLYILRQGYTYKNQVRLIDELYTQKKLPRLSVLLNDMKGGVGYGSYYGYGVYGYSGRNKYGYGYGYGYFDVEKKPKKKSILKKLFKA